MIDIFIVTSALAFSLAAAVAWNVGIGILVGMLSVSAMPLFRSGRKIGKAAKGFSICLASMAIAGIIFSYAGWRIALFSIADVHYYYYEEDTLVIDDIRIHPEISG